MLRGYCSVSVRHLLPNRMELYTTLEKLPDHNHSHGPHVVRAIGLIGHSNGWNGGVSVVNADVEVVHPQ